MLEKRKLRRDIFMGPLLRPRAGGGGLLSPPHIPPPLAPSPTPIPAALGEYKGVILIKNIEQNRSFVQS